MPNPPVKVCSTCKAWRPSTGECRMHPPMVIPAQGSQPPITAFPKPQPGWDCEEWLNNGTQ